MTPTQAESSSRPQGPSVFGFSGRIGRMRWLAYVSVAHMVLFAMAVFLGTLSSFVGVDPHYLILGPVVLFFFYYLLATIQRSHDMNWGAWTSILSFIPLVCLFWLFRPGTTGANRFGDRPNRNSTGVLLLAFFMPLMIAMSMAAVAILPFNSESMQEDQLQVSKLIDRFTGLLNIQAFLLQINPKTLR